MTSIYKLSLTASAMFMSISAAASAADIPKGTYGVNGFITSSTCESLSSALKKGTAAVSSVIYPGAGQLKMTLANPQTASTSKAGGAATEVCVAVVKVPAAGLDNANLTFNCYSDTVDGPAKSVLAQLKSKFNVGLSHATGVASVTVTSSLIVGGSALCKFTTDGTYSLQ